jgi:hypothetical protein
MPLFPLTECPRDEEQATLLGQKCLRKCSSDEDCKSKKKKCLCDGACGMSCIKPDRECPELEHPSLGTVVMSGKIYLKYFRYTFLNFPFKVELLDRERATHAITATMLSVFRRECVKHTATGPEVSRPASKTFTASLRPRSNMRDIRHFPNKPLSTWTRPCNITAIWAMRQPDSREPSA